MDAQVDQAKAVAPIPPHPVLFWIVIYTHVLALVMIAILVVFWFFPADIVVGANASVLVGLIFAAYNTISPKLEWIFGFGGRYLKFVVEYLRAVFYATLAGFIGLLALFVVYFGEITRSYNYIKAVNKAVAVLDAGRLSIPQPEALAAAFTLMPNRPEIPFILLRSASVLNFDDRPTNYYDYMKRFASQLDLETIAKRSAGLRRSQHHLIGAESDGLPVLDPILMLTYFTIDRDFSDPGYWDQIKWSVSALDRYRNDGEKDAVAKLWRDILQTLVDLKDAKDLPTILKIKQARLDILNSQINPKNIDSHGFALLITDHVYQEALSMVAMLSMGSAETDAGLPAQCAPNKVIAETFQRLLLLRAKLINKTDLVWWRAPQKIFLYRVYLHFGGLRGDKISNLVNTASKCPGLLDELKTLYSATALRAFQDPDTWHYGTALSPTLNGSASIELIRKWLRLGW